MRRGFTLLEVLIAMIVLVAAIATILPLFAVGTASHKRAMDQSSVSMIAPQISAKLQEGLVAERAGEPGNIKGAVIIHQGRTYRYDAAFTPLDPADPNRSAYVVRVTVAWNDPNPLTESFDTVLLRRMKR